MSILITGGLGFIGSHLIEELLCQNKHLVCIDNLSNSNIDVINRFSIKDLNLFNFYQINIHDKAEIEKIFHDHKIDSVIHCAGLKSVAESVQLPDKYFYNNVVGSKILLDVVKNFGVKNFIFSSSATVYGNPTNLPITEFHPVSATNPYAQNKIDVEKMFLNDPFFQQDCSVKILRYFNPIGAHPSSKIGESPKGLPNNLMPLIIRVARREQSKLLVYGDDYDTHDGTGVRDYIHVMDLIDGHLRALDYSKKGISIFNLGTGRGYSVFDLVKTFERVNKINIPVKLDKRRPGDVDSVFADTKKAEKIISFRAQRDLDQMCFDSWAFAKSLS